MIRLRTNTSRSWTSFRGLPPRTFTYEVPMTNIAVEFALFDDHPLDGVAVQKAINSGQHRLLAHLATHGDEWLLATDNPFISFIHEKCFIRIDSLKSPNGRLRMTYRTVLAIYVAYAEVFIQQGNDVEGVMRMSVADIIVGHGIVAVNDPSVDAIQNEMVSDI